MSESQKFFGKYRGTVVNNVDVMQMGRIQAIVPDVSSVALTSWCMPCVPVAGIQTGVFTVPPIGAGVWIEFEQGDPDYPIWAGCYWGSPAEVPAMAPVPHSDSPTQLPLTCPQPVRSLANVFSGADRPALEGMDRGEP